MLATKNRSTLWLCMNAWRDSRSARNLHTTSVRNSEVREKEYCAACVKNGLVECVGCKEWVSIEWTNAASYLKETKCLDCLNPRCRNPTCKTCKKCRDPNCASPDCQKKPKGLHGKILKLFGDKEKFLCEACLYPACETRTCQAKMPNNIRQLKRKKATWMQPTESRIWKCEGCEIRADFHRK